MTAMLQEILQNEADVTQCGTRVAT